MGQIENKSTEQDATLIPYYVHEREMDRSDRKFKMVVWLLVLVFVALVGSNAGWMIYENQFEDVVTTVTQETSSEGGGDAIINGNNAGAVIYGKGETDGNEENAN